MKLFVLKYKLSKCTLKPYRVIKHSRLLKKILLYVPRLPYHQICIQTSYIFLRSLYFTLAFLSFFFDSLNPKYRGRKDDILPISQIGMIRLRQLNHLPNNCSSYKINPMWYLYTMEFYAAIKKNEMLSFAGKWMELENIILSEVSLAQKTKNHMFSLICGH
jgi:hypothetical protein